MQNWLQLIVCLYIFFFTTSKWWVPSDVGQISLLNNTHVPPAPPPPPPPFSIRFMWEKLNKTQCSCHNLDTLFHSVLTKIWMNKIMVLQKLKNLYMYFVLCPLCWK